MDIITITNNENISIEKIEVFDVSGAGDTVISALTLAYASGATIREAAEIANHAAGVVCAKRGTACATPAEILDSFGDKR